MNNLSQRLKAHLEARRNGESGLALLDVLLGMAIFALIAVIAFQSMGIFRERAFVTQATSDARQVGTAVEAALTAPNATFTGIGVSDGVLDTAALDGLGVNLTGENRAIFTIVSGNGTDSGSAYTVCVDNNGNTDGKHIIYNSEDGAIGSPQDGACTTP